ncbi:hypothetical protein IWW49_005925, partial [Coemansia sp. RSA 1797]
MKKAFGQPLMGSAKWDCAAVAGSQRGKAAGRFVLAAADPSVWRPAAVQSPASTNE